ncbi:basic proline-rich protein-like [Pezoporus wallicus]|uniref:basic proline-rich protein-like n=1 Tax=Pezoporus wallicus TaxID=35540 RepID=UPI00254C0FC4|nr:basic proline-rich protein-like [Pezoporus wallicus]
MAPRRVGRNPLHQPESGGSTAGTQLRTPSRTGEMGRPESAPPPPPPHQLPPGAQRLCKPGEAGSSGSPAPSARPGGESIPPCLPPPPPEPSRRPQPGRARRRRYSQHPRGGKLTGGPAPPATSAAGSRSPQHRAGSERAGAGALRSAPRRGAAQLRPRPSPSLRGADSLPPFLAPPANAGRGEEPALTICCEAPPPSAAASLAGGLPPKHPAGKVGNEEEALPPPGELFALCTPKSWGCSRPRLPQDRRPLRAGAPRLSALLSAPSALPLHSTRGSPPPAEGRGKGSSAWGAPKSAGHRPGQPRVRSARWEARRERTGMGTGDPSGNRERMWGLILLRLAGIKSWPDKTCVLPT